MEATLFKVPAIALSQVCEDRRNIRWPTAERFAPEVIARLLATPWAPDVLMNVNFPDLDPDGVAGVRVTTQGKRKIGDTLLERTDPRGEPYLWIGALREDSHPAEGSDLAAIAAGYVSVTPIHLDMTHAPSLDELHRRFP
jgi:5'-nucleotidase